MNAVMGLCDDQMEVNYAVDFGRDREPSQKRSRRPEYRRSGSAPARVNGIHCRRNKRWTWGSGRGARVLNARAFAGCLAFAVASLAASAFGVTIDWKLVGNAPNSGNPASSPSGQGAVADLFRIASRETTNSQYVAFLNSVDPNGTNPNGIFNSSMQSMANGGITFSSSRPTNAKYEVKTTTAPSGAAYGAMPVNFVTWFSAARFVNWLNNGATPSSSTETGAYNLAGKTTGTIVTRNPAAQIFLPSQDQWYKAAFYNPSGSYNLFATGTSSSPTATTNFSQTNAGNFSGAFAGPVAVGSYVNTVSPYGLFDMLGNVTEITDTANLAGQYRAMGGGYAASSSAWNATASAIFQNGNFVNQTYGFRVAAVPEPGTIALAGMGIAGLAGLDWLKRRKKKRLAAERAAA